MNVRILLGHSDFAHSGVPDIVRAQCTRCAGLDGIPRVVVSHIHLDKALINRDVRLTSGPLAETIEIMWERKRAYTIEDVVARAAEVIDLAIQNGITRLRTHVEVDNIGGSKPLESVLATRERYKNLVVDIQIVAFPQKGILKNRGYRAFEGDGAWGRRGGRHAV